MDRVFDYGSEVCEFDSRRGLFSRIKGPSNRNKNFLFTNLVLKNILKHERNKFSASYY